MQQKSPDISIDKINLIYREIHSLNLDPTLAMNTKLTNLSASKIPTRASEVLNTVDFKDGSEIKFFAKKLISAFRSERWNSLSAENVSDKLHKILSDSQKKLSADTLNSIEERFEWVKAAYAQLDTDIYSDKHLKNVNSVLTSKIYFLGQELFRMNDEDLEKYAFTPNREKRDHLIVKNREALKIDVSSEISLEDKEFILYEKMLLNNLLKYRDDRLPIAEDSNLILQLIKIEPQLLNLSNLAIKSNPKPFIKFFYENANFLKKNINFLRKDPLLETWLKFKERKFKFSDLDEKLQNIKEIALNAVKLPRYEDEMGRTHPIDNYDFLNEELKADLDIVKKAVFHLGTDIYPKLAPDLRDNLEVAKVIAEYRPDLFRLGKTNLSPIERELFIYLTQEAFKKTHPDETRSYINVRALQYASPQLLSDKNYMLRLCNNFPRSVYYANLALRNDSEFMEKVIKLDFRNLYSIGQQLKDNQQFMDHMRSSYPDDVQFINDFASDPDAVH